jgi:hypothetical protein
MLTTKHLSRYNLHLTPHCVYMLNIQGVSQLVYHTSGGDAGGIDEVIASVT